MQDVHDEDVMRRFLLGESAPGERESVEDRFMTDPAYFEALCALEDELVLSHVRGDLPERWRHAFDAHVLASPAGRRRVEEAGQLQRALSSSGLPASPARLVSTRVFWKTPISLWMAAAAGIAAIVFSGWLIGRPAPDREAAVPREVNRLQAGAIATFVLAPGLTRSELGSSNVFRVESGLQQIRLELSVPARIRGSLRTVLRQVGGEPVTVPNEPEFHQNDDRVEVSWNIPAPLLPRGDYLLTVSEETPAGERETLASRFLSIVP